MMLGDSGSGMDVIAATVASRMWTGDEAPNVRVPRRLLDAPTERQRMLNRRLDVLIGMSRHSGFRSCNCMRNGKTVIEKRPRRDSGGRIASPLGGGEDVVGQLIEPLQGAGIAKVESGFGLGIG
jgi:hypothetical protein